MAVVPTYDVLWQQGEDGEINMIYSYNGAPVDLTGYSLRMDVRNAAGAQLFVFNSSDVSDPLDSVGTADNEAVLGSDGSINILIPRAASLGSGPFANMMGEELSYDIFLRSPANKQRKILKGTIIFEASATRWI
jgi:hypothetical protein